MELDPLSSTALIPFWARVQDGLADSPVLGDKAAVTLAESVEEHFGRVAVATSTQAGCCLRNRAIDDWVVALVAEEPAASATIVDIGVGLDTRLERLPHVARRYIEVEREPVVRLRDEWLPDSPAVRIAGDGMRVRDWVDEVGDRGSLTILILQGVLSYQDSPLVARFFAEAARYLPGAYVLFDSVSPLSAWMANRSGVPVRPRYIWTTWATKRIRAGASRLKVHQERGFMDFPRELTSSFSVAERLTHLVPPFRRSYRLTLARLPD